MSLVISNMVTCDLPKITFSLSSALMLRLFAASCSLFFLMYSHIFLVTSVRGIGVAPMTAANAGLMFIGFINAALGARFAGAAFFAVAILSCPFQMIVGSGRLNEMQASCPDGRC